MPKLKTKSSVKKRFKFSSTGKAISGQANKRHNMRKRSQRQIRNQRGTTALPEMECKRIEQWAPYGL